MLDTIIYIPTILAYAFIGLLVVILCFIVIYISHKVFISIYDNLPVPNSVSAFQSVPAEPTPVKGNKGRSAAVVKQYSIAPSSDLVSRKSKTALRIIVMLEPCYLAYVIFAYESTGGGGIMHTERRSPNPSSSSVLRYNKLVKYFDRLAAIPMGTVMQKCRNPEEEPEVSLTSVPRKISLPAERVTHMAILQNLIDDMVQNSEHIRKSQIRVSKRNLQ